MTKTRKARKIWTQPLCELDLDYEVMDQQHAWIMYNGDYLFELVKDDDDNRCNPQLAHRVGALAALAPELLFCLILLMNACEDPQGDTAYALNEARVVLEKVKEAT